MKTPTDVNSLIALLESKERRPGEIYWLLAEYGLNDDNWSFSKMNAIIAEVDSDIAMEKQEQKEIIAISERLKLILTGGVEINGIEVPLGGIIASSNCDRELGCYHVFGSGNAVLTVQWMSFNYSVSLELKDPADTHPNRGLLKIAQGDLAVIITRLLQGVESPHMATQASNRDEIYAYISANQKRYYSSEMVQRVTNILSENCLPK